MHKPRIFVSFRSDEIKTPDDRNPRPHIEPQPGHTP
jgi:hypothetical protein